LPDFGGIFSCQLAIVKRNQAATWEEHLQDASFPEGEDIAITGELLQQQKEKIK